MLIRGVVDEVLNVPSIDSELFNIYPWKRAMNYVYTN